MTSEERILQLEKQLDLISSQLDECRRQIDAFKNEPSLSSLKVGPKIVTKENKGFALENFVGLKLIHFVGIIVLVAGISFGVKYAIDQNLINATGRIILAWLAGSLLFILALLLKNKYQTFSAILFSGSMASLYFTSFGACVYYAIIARWVAFILMIGFTLCTVTVAIFYRRQEIALLGMVGAYGIPFLIGSNTPDMLSFFGYILLINGGILLIQFLKNWRLLKRLSMVIAWIIFLSWCISDYTLASYYLAFGIGIAFFSIFLISLLAYAAFRRLPVGLADTVFICLNSLAFYMAALIVYSINFVDYLGPVTLVFLMLHAGLTFTLKLILPQSKNLIRGFLIMTMIWTVMYVPVLWSGLEITLVWVVLAISSFLLGLWQKVRVLRIFSIFLFTLTLLKLILLDGSQFSTASKMFSYLLIGAVLLIISFLYQHYRHIIFGDEKKEGS